MVGIALPALAWDSFRLEAKGTDNLPNSIIPCNPISKFFTNRPASWPNAAVLLQSSAVHVAVTGGTGFVGKAVVQTLAAQGWKPRLLLRASPTALHSASQHPPSSCRGSQGLEVRRVNFSSRDDVASACRGVDAIVHLVGIIAELGSNTFQEAHVGLTARMLQAGQDAGIRRYLHMSALGTREAARSQYHRTKWSAETLVRASGLDWTIFRPSLIYGTNGGFTAVFEQLSRFSPFLPALGGGRGLLQPIANEQVARAFAEALRTPSAIGQTYDLCGPERLEFRQILEAILASLGRRRIIVPIPFALARIQARFLEFLWPRLLRRAPPLNRDQILMLEEDNIGNGTAADTAFGLVHPSFRSGLAGRHS